MVARSPALGGVTVRVTSVRISANTASTVTDSSPR